MHYYPHNIGDFNQATRHLTRLERSIYRDLIDLYYDTETQISLDLKIVCRKILALSNDESTAVEQTLNEFFTKTPTGYYNDRCEREIESYQASVSQKSLAGKASAAKRADKLQQMLNEIPTAVEQTLNGASTKQELRTNKQELLKPLTNKLIDQDFQTFWKTYPKKVGKDAALKAWLKLKPNLQDVLTAIAWQKETPKWTDNNGKYIKDPVNYLTNGHWKDEKENTEDEALSLKIRNSCQYATKPENKSFAQQRDESRAILASSIFKDKYIAEQTGDFLESDYEKLK